MTAECLYAGVRACSPSRLVVGIDTLHAIIGSYSLPSNPQVQTVDQKMVQCFLRLEEEGVARGEGQPTGKADA